jgi:catechol 2,3-dioxygenase-like lactoylglutathione lyase family enzyme
MFPMPLATFKDLCLDATDHHALGTFYAQVLGLTYVSHEGNAHLEGPTKAHTIWINPVPEPKTVKHRVHIDVTTQSLAHLEALGATIGEHHEQWTVMADPEGGEFCAFVRDHVDSYRFYGLIVDAADPHAIGTWWADVMGGKLSADSEDPAVAIDAMPQAPFDAMVFLPVPEPKTVKNRIHWDVTTDSVEALLERGATMIRPKDSEIAWDVLADPEGNEFCAFTT